MKFWQQNREISKIFSFIRHNKMLTHINCYKMSIKKKLCCQMRPLDKKAIHHFLSKPTTMYGQYFFSKDPGVAINLNIRPY